MEKSGKSAIAISIVMSIILIVGSLVVALIPNLFKAQPIGTSEISKVVYDVHVAETGELAISETLTYDVSSINGIIRDYRYRASDNQNLVIDSVIVDNQVAERVDYAYTGDKLVYTYKPYSSSQEVKIYYPTSGIANFTINYRVQGLVSNYLDMQDLYWMFYDTYGQSAPKTIEATIHFPKAIGKENMKLFGHGDVEGEMTIVDDRTISVRVDGFYNDGFAEVRVLMPTKPLTGMTTIIDEHKYEAALSYETEEARKTDVRIARNRRQETLSKILTYISLPGAILGISLIFLAIREVYNKYDKEIYDFSELEYYRETPTAYGPSVAALVMNPEDIPDQNQLIASLFNLYVHKIIKLEIVEKSKRKSDVIITLLKDQTADESVRNTVDTVDYHLYQWLVRDFGPEKTKSYEAFLKRKTQSVATARKVVQDYESFISEITRGYRALYYQQYNGKANKMPKVALLALVLPVLLLIVAGVMLLFDLVPINIIIVLGIQVMLLIVMSGAVAAYKNNCYQLTEVGAREQAQCRGLKKYLEDYSLLSEAAPTAIHMWERYFVYGLALGVSKEALNKLYERIPREVREATGVDFNTIYMMNRLNYNYNIARYSQTSVNAAQSVVRSASVSRSSGSGGSFGGGGGFSGGGGFGGGGGGSHSF